MVMDEPIPAPKNIPNFDSSRLDPEQGFEIGQTISVDPDQNSSLHLEQSQDIQTQPDQDPLDELVIRDPDGSKSEWDPAVTKSDDDCDEAVLISVTKQGVDTTGDQLIKDRFKN